jgi:CRISPR/Cas system CMR-associated protein Cmr5 small subunit
MTGTPTLDQKRAAHAWQAAQRARNESDFDTFATMAKKLPVMIQRADWVTPWRSWGEEEGARAIESPQPMDRGTASGSSGKNRTLLERVVEGDSGFLIRATAEALSYLKWLGRFTEGLEKKAKNGNEK